jgi:hypothetical protein
VVIAQSGVAIAGGDKIVIHDVAYLTACHRSATEGRWVSIAEILGS